MMWMTLAALAGSPLDNAADALVEPARATGALDGIAIVTARRGDVSRHTYGPMTRKSRVPLGAASQGFVGVLLADSVARGEVQLDDLLSKHLNWAVPSTITLRHLATHTSGWGRVPDRWAQKNGNTRPILDEAALREIASRPPEDTPGDVFRPSPVGMAVLGHALAAAAGLDWNQLVSTRLAKPLGADLTVDHPKVVPGHDAAGTQTKDWNTHALAPAAGLDATLDALETVLLASQTPGGALGHALEESFTPMLGLGDAGHVGLGWHITPEGVRWSNGQTAGHHVLIAIHPERALAVAVVADRATPLTDQVGFAMMEVLAGQNVAPLALPSRVP